jgi:hypothetical protein
MHEWCSGMRSASRGSLKSMATWRKLGAAVPIWGPEVIGVLVTTDYQHSCVRTI